MSWKEAMRLRKAIAREQQAAVAFLPRDARHWRRIAFWDMVWTTGVAS